MRPRRFNFYSRTSERNCLINRNRLYGRASEACKTAPRSPKWPSYGAKNHVRGVLQLFIGQFQKVYSRKPGFRLTQFSETPLPHKGGAGISGCELLQFITHNPCVPITHTAADARRALAHALGTCLSSLPPRQDISPANGPSHAAHSPDKRGS